MTKRTSENSIAARRGGGIDYWPNLESNYADPDSSDIINISAIK